ncbi:AAA family ATPase [Hirschia baltica]|uniref:AAA family ATPase n=1 Tax=Hirschia baltica TaxID=2724 RepID=UPI00059C0143|nr:AAA family ATPase [Hirschia baltica]
MIFLSYSSENQKQADRVSQFMSEHGFENWQDDQKLKPGDEFEDIIIRKVQTSRCLVLLLTRASLKSEWVKKEVETAIASNIPIIPISNVPAVELRDEIDESSAWASKLVQSIQFISYHVQLTQNILNKLLEALEWRLSEDALASIFSFVNFKGGIGKTSLCASAACCFASKHNKRVLLIDLDPQENLSDLLLTRHALAVASAEGHTALSLFEPKRVCKKVGREYDFKFLMAFAHDVETNWSSLAMKISDSASNGSLSIIPADYRMMKFAKASVTAQEVYLYNFSKSVRALSRYYDAIFIDSGPSASLLTHCALKFADNIISPVRADYNAVRGLYSMQQAALNVFDCDIDGKTYPVFNFYRLNNVTERDFANDFSKSADKISSLVSFVKNKVLETRIPLTQGMIGVEKYLNAALNSELKDISFGAANESMHALSDELLLISDAGTKK